MATNNPANPPSSDQGQSLLVLVGVPLIVAVLGLAGVMYTAVRSSETGELKGRKAVTSELKPTIDAIPASIATAEARGKQASLAELQPTIDALSTLVTKNQACDQVSVTATPDQITVVPPSQAPVWTSIIYELKAPSNIGMRILLHSSEFLVSDGTKQVVTQAGQQATHYNKIIPAGKSLVIDNDGISLDQAQVEKAREFGSTVMIERKTYHLVSDQGIYYQKSVDVRVSLK